MGGYRPLLRNDVAVLAPQAVAHVGVYLQVQGLDLLPEALDLLPEVRGFVAVQPVIGGVGEVVEAGRLVVQLHVFLVHVLHFRTDRVPPLHPDVLEFFGVSRFRQDFGDF